MKGFAEKLTGVLFPVRDDELWMRIGMSAEDTNALYDAMISVFDTVIDAPIPSP